MQAKRTRRTVLLMNLGGLVAVTMFFASATLVLLGWQIPQALLAALPLGASLGLICWRALVREQVGIGGVLAFLAVLFGHSVAFVLLCVWYRGTYPDWVYAHGSNGPISHIGLGLGVILGFVLTLSLLSPIKTTRHLLTKLSAESIDLVVRHLGSWLIGVTALGVGLGAVPVLFLSSSAELKLAVSAVVSLAVVGAVLWAVGAVRIERRYRWYERIFLGQEPGWEIVPREELNLDLDGLLPLRGSALACDAVIVHRRRGREKGAYRTGETLEPYALIAAPLQMQAVLPRYSK